MLSSVEQIIAKTYNLTQNLIFGGSKGKCKKKKINFRRLKLFSFSRAMSISFIYIKIAKYPLKY